jgi:hypothetical protein
MKNLANRQDVQSGQKKKEPDYAKYKKAFDKVMEYYPVEEHIDLFGSSEQREADRQRIAAELQTKILFYSELPIKNKKRGQGTVAPKGVPVKNITDPTILDFKIDVETQIRKVIHNRKHMVMFFKRYAFGIEDLSKNDQHLFARYEQQIGQRFIRAKIYPLGQYFVSIRKRKERQ